MTHPLGIRTGPSHMADTDERAMGRVQRMLAADEPELPGFDQDRLAIDRSYIDFPLVDGLPNRKPCPSATPSSWSVSRSASVSTPPAMTSTPIG